jgi:NADPH:quinone reductase-like Zn-dependent oxidoreductase
MKVYRIATYSGPSGLELCDEPAPLSPRDRQVVVRVRASSLNFRELMDVQGLLARIAPLAERRIPGSDAAGEVITVGPAVTRVKPGDRVATIFYADWIHGPMPPNMRFIGRSALQDDGTLTEFTVVHEDELVHLPPHLSFEEAATLPCAGVTAWTSLFEHARVKPGDAVLVEGSGGVAVFALQFARMAGARVIATTTTATKRPRLLELGASEVIVASPEGEWAKEILDATDRVGVDWAISTAGGEALDGCIAATRPGGGIVLVGVRDSSTRAKPNLGFQMRGVSMHPTRVGNRDHFEAMNRALVANPAVRPVIDRVFDFGEAKAAFEYFAAARQIGKVVIRH